MTCVSYVRAPGARESISISRSVWSVTVRRCMGGTVLGVLGLAKLWLFKKPLCVAALAGQSGLLGGPLDQATALIVRGANKCSSLMCNYSAS